MMRTTLIFVAVALGSLAAAISMRPQEIESTTFEDTGTPLFKDFTDPTLATSLEVIEWDEEAAKVRPFKVEQKEGRWVIPSHHDYPADATERMGKAAASFVGVKKDIYYGDDADQHAAFGLLDPQDAAGSPEEKGRRITIKDGSGNTLVDILVGKDIPDKEGYVYVRFPDDKRVYGTKIDLDVSTEFTEWIEKDLLHIERDDIVALLYDPYTVDEKVGRVVGTDPIQLKLETGDGEGAKEEWTPGEKTKVPPGKALDQAKVRQMVGAIDRLQIVGVRQRPERLTLPVLQSHGFFVNTNTGRLFGNEGEIHAITGDGVVFTLFFGEVTFESGLALTSGQESKDEDGKEGEDEEGAERKGNRYMFVDASFDPTYVTEAGDAEAGKKEAEELRARFDQWFFVISDQSFKQIHKSRDEMWKDEG